MDQKEENLLQSQNTLPRVKVAHQKPTHRHFNFYVFIHLFIYLFIFLAVTVQVMGSVHRMFG